MSLAMAKGGDFDAANKKLKKALTQEQSLRSAEVNPKAENLEKLTLNVDGLAKSSKELQNLFEAYRPKPEDVADFAPESFGGLVSSYKARLDEKFASMEVALPENCIYGFKDYVRTRPKPAATGDLKYQMRAFEWLFGQLADTQPEALLNVVRPALEIEKKTGEGDEQANEDVAYVVMPLELAFKADEDSYTAFLESIANSEKYAFSVRYLRIQNEKQLPPTAKDAKFDPPKVEPAINQADGFGAFDNFVDEEAVDGEAAAEEVVEELPENNLAEVASDDDTTRILSPILGEEKVDVFLKLDLILLKEGSKVSLDEAKEAAGVKKSSATTTKANS